MEDFTNLLAKNARQIGEMLDAKLSNHIESGEIDRKSVV